MILVVCNFSTQAINHYRVGIPGMGKVKEVFNTDSLSYGGSDLKNSGTLKTENIESHGRKYSIEISVPALAMVALKFD